MFRKSINDPSNIERICKVIAALKPDHGDGDEAPNHGKNISAVDLASFEQIRNFLIQNDSAELIADITLRDIIWHGGGGGPIKKVYSGLYNCLRDSYQDNYTLAFLKLILDGLAKHPCYNDLINGIFHALSQVYICSNVHKITAVKTILDNPAFKSTSARSEIGILVEVFMMAYEYSAPDYSMRRNHAPFALQLIDLLINHGSYFEKSFNLPRMLLQAEILYATNNKLNANVITKIKEAQSLNSKNNPYTSAGSQTTLPTATSTVVMPTDYMSHAVAAAAAGAEAPAASEAAAPSLRRQF